MAGDLSPFRNEPPLELRRAAVREGLVAALPALEARLPLRVGVWIGEERREGEEIVSTDPGQPERVVALAARATVEEVEAAVAAAERAAPEWGRRPAAERAAALVAAAAHLRERRAELAALEVRECAKPWPEADGDLCEAIDFLEYYARQAIELERPPALLQPPGERNEMRYGACGVAAVIAPWNFPIAIPAGMTAAALATGNPVVLKPAEQSPGCGLALVEALRAGGVPPAAISLLPGEGEVGAALVDHPKVRLIAFTGSAAVGLRIVESAARVRSGQHHLKRVIAEMGGKNCVIVDGDADLDEAVPAIVASAFGYAGQKCSAAARVLVHEAIGDELLQRLSGAVDLLVVDQADRLGTDVPPVIEREARDRVAGYATEVESRGRVVARAAPPTGAGWFCAPTVATDLPEDADVLREEVFGPLLTVETVRDVEDACERVEALPFALTGGLFSRNPATVREVIARSPVGNLYVNRPITGAVVARQPFGGTRLSGTGTKAGGPDYLWHFVEPRVVSENTVRHGLVA